MNRLTFDDAIVEHVARGLGEGRCDHFDEIHDRLRNIDSGSWVVHDAGDGFEVHQARGGKVNDGSRGTFSRAEAELVAEAPTDMAHLAWIAEKFPCDAGCYEVTEERCSRDGLSPKDLWKMADELTEEVQVLRGVAEAARDMLEGTAGLTRLVEALEGLDAFDADR